jgi:hypothetical protein
MTFSDTSAPDEVVLWENIDAWIEGDRFEGLSLALVAFEAAIRADERGRYEALEAAAEELMKQFDAFQTRPSRDSAFGISFERWSALRAALAALTRRAP